MVKVTENQCIAHPFKDELKKTKTELRSLPLYHLIHPGSRRPWTVQKLYFSIQRSLPPVWFETKLWATKKKWPSLEKIRDLLSIRWSHGNQCPRGYKALSLWIFQLSPGTEEAPGMGLKGRLQINRPWHCSSGLARTMGSWGAKFSPRPWSCCALAKNSSNTALLRNKLSINLSRLDTCNWAATPYLQGSSSPKITQTPLPSAAFQQLEAFLCSRNE